MIDFLGPKNYNASLIPMKRAARMMLTDFRHVCDLLGAIGMVRLQLTEYNKVAVAMEIEQEVIVAMDFAAAGEVADLLRSWHIQFRGIVRAVDPAAIEHCMAPHVGPAKGHARLLEILDKRPLLALDTADEEGVGGASALALVKLACEVR